MEQALCPEKRKKQIQAIMRAKEMGHTEILSGQSYKLHTEIKEEENNQDDEIFESASQINVMKAEKLKAPITILIGNILSIKRVLLNDLLRILM